MNDFEKKKEEVTKSVRPVAPVPIKKNTEMVNLSKKIDRTNALLADMNSVVGSRGTLKNYLNSIKQTQLEKTMK